jgi:hypothetical protein|tara:strand:+ start:793 stop:1368 length:576 start_codon:yes stop_codon:yes gene_type:complete
MSYKSENWKEKLEEVRMHVALKEGSVEKSADDILSDQIDEELATFFVEDTQEVILEASSGSMIDKLFNLKGDKDAQYGVAKMLSMTGVKVVQQMQKQNPKGFTSLVVQLGKEKKITLPTDSKLQKMFKDAGVKPLPEETVEEVKEEKLSVERTITKLTEKNMLGRLSKSLRLDEEGKEKLFNYFDKGELEQ